MHPLLLLILTLILLLFLPKFVVIIILIVLIVLYVLKYIRQSKDLTTDKEHHKTAEYRKTAERFMNYFSSDKSVDEKNNNDERKAKRRMDRHRLASFVAKV